MGRGIRSTATRDKTKQILVSVLESHGELSIREIIKVIKQEKLSPSPQFVWGSRRISSYLNMLKREGRVSKKDKKWKAVGNIIYCPHCGEQLKSKPSGAYVCPSCKCTFRLVLVYWMPKCFNKHHSGREREVEKPKPYYCTKCKRKHSRGAIYKKHLKYMVEK